MKQCNNQACHTSLQRHHDDLAPLHLFRIKSVMCAKCEETIRISRGSRLLLSWWSSKDDKARIYFVSSSPPFTDLGQRESSATPSPKPCIWAEPGWTLWTKARSSRAHQQTRSLLFVFPWTMPGFFWHKCSANGSKSTRLHFHTQDRL